MGNSAFRLGATQATATKVSEIISQASHGFSVGDAIRVMPGTTGAYMKAKADTAENAEVIGVVSESSSVNSFTVVYAGEISTTGLTGFGQTDVLFLSADVEGQLTSTAPSLPGQVIKPVVVMQDTNNALTNDGVVINYVGTVIGGESSVEVSNLQPVGTVIPWAGATGSEPTGWLVCDGATYFGGYTGAGATYADLFSVIGTAFGGSGTNGPNDYFHVPNLIGRVPVGAGLCASSGLTQRVVGDVGGTETSDAIVGSAGTLDTLGTETGNTGTVSVMQPFTVTNYLIRYEKNSRASISGLLANDLADIGTIGATVGHILQFEANGTTGVYESVSIDQALTGGFSVAGGTANFIGVSGAAPTTALNVDGNLNILSGLLQFGGATGMTIRQILTVDERGVCGGVDGFTATHASFDGPFLASGLRFNNVVPQSSHSTFILAGHIGVRCISDSSSSGQVTMAAEICCSLNNGETFGNAHDGITGTSSVRYVDVVDDTSVDEFSTGSVTYFDIVNGTTAGTFNLDVIHRNLSANTSDAIVFTGDFQGQQRSNPILIELA